MNKTIFYQNLAQQVSAIIAGEDDSVANFANVSAILFNELDNVNWAGFYRFKEDQLVLGPFQGQPACIRIPIGKGVCGVAAETRFTQRVDDVHQFAGHIACDAASNSEIVIPVVKNDQLIGVLDIDSPIFARFDQEDEVGLTHIVQLLVEQIE